ncbi:unnamed protein product [Arctogadus glacialis]
MTMAKDSCLVDSECFVFAKYPVLSRMITVGYIHHRDDFIFMKHLYFKDKAECVMRPLRMATGHVHRLILLCLF